MNILQTLILIGLLIQFSRADTIESSLRFYREKVYLPEWLNQEDVLPRYLFHRFEHYMDSCYAARTPPIEDTRELILRKLLTAHCRLYGPVKADGEALQHYLDAYELSRKSGYKILEAECLRGIIGYGLFTKNIMEALPRYIEQHHQLVYDDLEKLQNKYFELRYEIEYTFASHLPLICDEERWLDAIAQCEQKGYYRLAAEFHSALGPLLDNIGAPEQALYHYQKAIDNSRNYSASYEASIKFSSLANMGAIEMVRENYGEALRLFHQACGIGVSRQMLANKAMIFEWMSKCFENLNHYDSAHYYLQLSHQAVLQNKGLEHASEVLEIQRKYDTEKLTFALAEETLRRKNNNLLALAIGLCLFLTLSLIWLKYEGQRQKTKNVQQQLITANKETQLAAVNARLDGQEEERKNLAMHLHDHIAGQLVAAGMHLKIAGIKQDKESLEKSAGLLHDVGLQLRAMSHELFPPLLIKLGLGPALTDLIEKYSNNSIRFHINQEAVQIKHQGNAASKIYYAVQELLNNVIKHSQATSCRVNLHQDKDHLCIRIQDNGKGFDPGLIHDSGLGMATVRARIESLGGRYEYNLYPETGPEQTISVPIINFE